MNLILRILIGTALAAGGVYMVMKTLVFINFFGSVDWFDQKLGPGGTALFYKLLGILLCLIGFLLATNLWDAFLNATLGSFIPH